MFRVIILYAAFSLAGICTYGQNLIGYKYMEIKKYMKENHSEMSLNNVSNSKFKYLKYSDSSDRQTMLFFLNSDSVCLSIRMICDAAIKEVKTREFNSVYKTTGENRWLDRHEGKDYIIKIADEKWYYSISMEPDK